MKRCSRCTLPDTIKGIIFDEEGVCNFCRDYRPIEYLGEDRLAEVFEEAKKREGKYDCIVPLSGGRDSSYVLYLAAGKYGLKTLAVNFDNEFRSDQAPVNMKKACDVLGVDFVSMRSKRDIARKIVASSIKHSSRAGLKTLATSFCDACAYGYHAAVFMMAEKNDVPLILWGSSRMEYTEHITDPFFVESKTLGSRLLNQPRVLKLKLLRLLQRLEFYVPGNLARSLRLAGPVLMNDSIKEVKVFDYIPWDQETIVNTIQSELGWSKPDEAVSTWRTDCELEKLVEYCFMNLFGCSKRCLGYHNMINEGQMTAEEALELENQVTPEFTEELRKLLEDIGLSEREIELIRSFRNELPGNGFRDHG